MKLRLFAAPFATLLTIASLGMLVHGEVPDVPTGQWLAGPALVQPRAGAVSVALDDGRVLVIGGRTADGPVNTVEVFGTDGSIALGLPMLAPRVGHGAVKLPDGRVYVTGGTTLATTQTDHGPVTTEAATDSAEIFYSSLNAWGPGRLARIRPHGSHCLERLLTVTSGSAEWARRTDCIPSQALRLSDRSRRRAEGCSRLPGRSMQPLRQGILRCWLRAASTPKAHRYGRYRRCCQWRRYQRGAEHAAHRGVRDGSAGWPRPHCGRV